MQPYGLAFEKLLAEPLGPGVPVPLDADRLARGPRGGDARGREGVLPALVRAGERGARHRRRHRPARRRARSSRSGSARSAGRSVPRAAAPAPKPLGGEKRVTMEDGCSSRGSTWRGRRRRSSRDGRRRARRRGPGALGREERAAREAARHGRADRAERLGGADRRRRSRAMFLVVATPKPGVSLARLEKEIDEEIARLAAEPPTRGGAAAREEQDRGRRRSSRSSRWAGSAAAPPRSPTTTCARGTPASSTRTSRATARSPREDVSAADAPLPAQGRARRAHGDAARGAPEVPPPQRPPSPAAGAPAPCRRDPAPAAAGRPRAANGARPMIAGSPRPRRRGARLRGPARREAAPPAAAAAPAAARPPAQAGPDRARRCRTLGPAPELALPAQRHFALANGLKRAARRVPAAARWSR